ncbi:HNH endonuclease signature motif containing protein, partial [Arthrobacter sp. UNC362MFTsu5.1]|uniref:HNH endonuclease signature motif containing protein n=1 Tax=Arthrobacter sp. UNC362MFTsu5.1 TaxID=1449044 RepID=UPI0005BE1F17
DAAGMGFREAADFAAIVEGIARTTEYLQVVAAGSVDRTRREASAAARAGSGSGVGWTTGWGEATAVHGPIDWATSEADTSPNDTSQAAKTAVSGEASVPAEPDPADDGCRNTTEFLRARLRIGAGEARRRLALAEAVLPRTGITGHTQPPERPELAAAVAAGTVASRSATIITLALDRVGHHADAEVAGRMEHALTRAAVEHDTDFVARVARQWTEAIDQDGSEPTDTELRQRQGVFIRQPRRGLQRMEIFATTEQSEHLLTAMNTATNPRTQPGEGSAGDNSTGALDDLDQRTRPQQLLDGLVGAVKAGLTTGGLPAAGGLRPQVMVTIDYRDLLARLENLEHGTGIPGTGLFTFTGPVTAATVRKIACDADIIPVLLGSQGRILDIGRTTRVFPPHIRKALAARDQGCAFPGCTIPTPWCEAHHITYWSHGGTTSTDNGTLLCSHHHHLIHKEQWQIHVKTGIPWFIPPPHIDPRQIPRRNNYFRLE